MDVLKKIKASTLVETIVASIIIVLIFGIAMLIINNVYKSTLLTDTSLQNYELNKLMYQIKNKALSYPSTEEFEGFDISIEQKADKVLFNIIKNGNTLKTKTIFSTYE